MRAPRPPPNPEEMQECPPPPVADPGVYPYRIDVVWDAPELGGIDEAAER